MATLRDAAAHDRPLDPFYALLEPNPWDPEDLAPETVFPLRPSRVRTKLRPIPLLLAG